MNLGLPITITMLNKRDHIKREEGGINVGYLSALVTRATNLHYMMPNPYLWVTLERPRDDVDTKKRK